MTPELGGEEREVLDHIRHDARIGGTTLTEPIFDALDALDVGDRLSIVERCAERLALGQKQYGRLNLAADKRDFMAEVLPELLDALVYIACHEVQQEKRAAAEPVAPMRIEMLPTTPAPADAVEAWDADTEVSER